MREKTEHWNQYLDEDADRKQDITEEDCLSYNKHSLGFWGWEAWWMDKSIGKAWRQICRTNRDENIYESELDDIMEPEEKFKASLIKHGCNPMKKWNDRNDDFDQFLDFQENHNSEEYEQNLRQMYEFFHLYCREGVYPSTPMCQFFYRSRNHLPGQAGVN